MVKNSGKNLISLAIVIAGLIIAGAIIYINQQKESECPKVFSSQQIEEKVIKYINENILQGQATAVLKEIVKESGLYKVLIQVGDQEFPSYVSLDGKILFPDFIDMEETPAAQPEAQEEKIYTIGNFSVTKDEICKENEKPIIYFFGSKSCPHCTWEHPIMEEVAKNFEKYISFHNNMDSNADLDVFGKYSTGGIPTLVLGCKYYRVGSGERVGEEQESKNLTALICKLTENQPVEICNSVQDLIDQIKQ